MCNINLKKIQQNSMPVSYSLLQRIYKDDVEDIQRSSNESIRHSCILDRVRDQKWIASDIICSEVTLIKVTSNRYFHLFRYHLFIEILLQVTSEKFHKTSVQIERKTNLL